MRNRWVLATTCVLVALGLLLCAERASLAKQPAKVPDPADPATPQRSVGQGTGECAERWRPCARRPVETGGASSRTAGTRRARERWSRVAARWTACPPETGRPRRTRPEPASAPRADHRSPVAQSRPARGEGVHRGPLITARGGKALRLTGESRRTRRGSTRRGVHGVPRSPSDRSPYGRTPYGRTLKSLWTGVRYPIPTSSPAQTEAGPRAPRQPPEWSPGWRGHGPAGGYGISWPAGRVGGPAGQREYPYAGKRFGGSASAAGRALRAGHGQEPGTGRPPPAAVGKGPRAGVRYEGKTANAPAGLHHGRV